VTTATTAGYSGEEALHGADVRLANASILDFWQWAYCDLKDNTGRGVFAEWMVAKLLRLPASEPRPPWQAWDITTPDGLTLEVKASAYVQTFGDPANGVLGNPSKIRFSRLKTRRPLDRFGKKIAEEKTYNADLYVFCVELCAQEAAWDPLDLGQWEFYVLERDALQDLGQSSMNLRTLRKVASETAGGPFPAESFRDRSLELISEWAARPDVCRRGRRMMEAGI